MYVLNDLIHVYFSKYCMARAFVTHLTLLEQVQGDGRAALFEGVDEAMDEDEDWHDEEDAEMSAEDE
jgi:hypothetical protein